MEDANKLDQYVATCQIGITISSLLLGMYGQDVIAGLLVEPLSFLSDWASFITAETLSLVLVLIIITSLQSDFGRIIA